MPRKSNKLDRKRKFGTVRCAGAQYAKCKYSQDLKYYDFNGEYVMDIPGQVQPPGDGTPVRKPEAAKKKTPAEVKQDSLSKAADKLKGFTADIPDADKEAVKENAEALAAEENA